MPINSKEVKVGEVYYMNITGFTELFKGKVEYINANKHAVMRVLGKDASKWSLLKDGEYLLQAKVEEGGAL